MSLPSFPTITEQVSTYLREELLRGRWSGEMPGQKQLAKLLGVSAQTVELALGLLEKDGILVGRGTGRRRKIVLPEGGLEVPALRVAILDYSPPEETEQWGPAMRQQLQDQGHSPFFAEKSLTELGMDLRRIIRLVKRTPADAWVVCAGSSEVLEWFAQQETPAFAVFGGRHGLPIAGTGPDKTPALVEATRRLVALGHRRISFLCRREVRLPQPAPGVRAFLDELEATGIATGAFNLPDWEADRDGFGSVLDSLLDGPTPPTALILDEPFLFNAGFYHLTKRGLRVPQDVSLICTDPDPTFTWCDPSVAHIRWDYRPVVRRVKRWVDNVAHGTDDRRQTLTKAEFVEGGTIGPVAKS